MASKEEIAWAAGLYEGEGTLASCNKTYRVNGRLRDRHTIRYTIRIALTDKDILIKWQRIMGGKIFGPCEDTRVKRQPIYKLHLNVSETIEACRKMYPWLGERRKERIDDLIGGEVHAL